MMPSWFLRLNRRERVLSAVIAGSLFLLLNYLIWSGLLGGISGINAEMAGKKTTRAAQLVYIKERDLWASREVWLKKNQPVSKGPAEVSTLLNQLKEIAGKHKVLIENPVLGGTENTADRQSVSASVETKSPWPPLIRWLYDVQQPESFVVFESVGLAIDTADPTMMRGKFKVARWFAPAGGNNEAKSTR